MTGRSPRVNIDFQLVIRPTAGGTARTSARRSSKGIANVSAMASTGVPMPSQLFAASAPGATYRGRAAASG